MDHTSQHDKSSASLLLPSNKHENSDNNNVVDVAIGPQHFDLLKVIGEGTALMFHHFHCVLLINFGGI